jgi:heterodisulfide reductase subunit A-like polyferredoxin
VRVKFTPQSLPEAADSQVCEEEFDLVVLAVGIRPAPDAPKLAEILTVPVDEHGFFGFKSAAPLPGLQREGIFVAGACESPKDIAACMRDAQVVSAAVISEA